MQKTRLLKGGLLFIIGYLLSPLSFWNDIFINIPIAYGLGFLAGLIHKPLFLPVMIFGYWLTNAAGFILMHYGVVEAIDKSDKLDKKKTRRQLIINIIASLVYTAIIFIIVKLGWLKFPLDY